MALAVRAWVKWNRHKNSRLHLPSCGRSEPVADGNMATIMEYP